MVGIWALISGVFWAVEQLSTLGLGVVTFALSVPSPTESGYLKWWVDYIKLHPFEFAIPFASVVVLSKIAQWVIVDEKSKEELIVQRLIGEALSKFKKRVFPGIPSNEPEDHNRVTIFKHQKKHWAFSSIRIRIFPPKFPTHPGSGWLVSRYRSGHTTKNRKTIFLAPDDAQHCEGVAGRGWRSGAVRVGHQNRRLPDVAGVRHICLVRRWYIIICRSLRWSQIDATRSELAIDLVREYAQMTLCEPSFVWSRIKRKRPNPTSILAMMIRDGHNEPWGVIVMDSVNQFECLDTEDTNFKAALTNLDNELRRLGVFE